MFVDKSRYVVKTGDDRGKFCRIVAPQERVRGRVNTGDVVCGVELEGGGKRMVRRDWLYLADSKLGRQVIRNVAKRKAGAA